MSRIVLLLATAGLALGLPAPASAQDPTPSPAPGAEGTPQKRPPRLSVDTRMMGQDEITRIYDLGRLSDEARPEQLERRKLPRDRLAGVFVGPTALFTSVRDFSTTAMVVGPPADVEFQSRLDVVRRALLEGDLPGLLAQSLRQLAPAASYDGDPPEGIAVSVAFYGLRSREDDPSLMEADDDYCFVAVGSAIALVSGGAGPDVPFQLSMIERSPDMADPVCASYLDLSDRGGYRLRQVMQQSADNLAQWLVGGVLGGR